jgi:hypothetical protein
MPISSDIDELGTERTDHSGARWMVAVALCLIMVGLACTL